MDTLPSAKLADAYFEIHGRLQDQARRMEVAGQRIVRLNLGNPAQFGFEAPERILRAVIENMNRSHGYTESRGLRTVREAILRYHRARGILGLDADRIYLGNGVSELAATALQALVNDGDEVLVPSPDYPLWTTSVRLCGGRAVYYRCDERSGWFPDVSHLASKISRRTKAVVLINPNNPTGAVYSRDLLADVAEVARKHRLIVFSDEIYENIVFDDVTHVPTAAVAPDLLCLTFSGLSKTFRVPGFRAGWLAISGPTSGAKSYISALELLLAMRLCANVLAQHAIEAALSGEHGITDLVKPGGRLRDQRDRAWTLLTSIPGVSCVKPSGALYAFPRLDPDLYAIADDVEFAMELLIQQKILVVPGSGLSWPATDHFRIVTLPQVPDLEDAIGRISDFLSTMRRPLRGSRGIAGAHAV